VGLFNRDKPQIETSLAEQEVFQRLSIREVLVFNSWGEGNVFVHIEKNERNSVKAFVSGSWYSIDVTSAQWLLRSRLRNCCFFWLYPPLFRTCPGRNDSGAKPE
jgi:hypothetical protein